MVKIEDGRTLDGPTLHQAYEHVVELTDRDNTTTKTYRVEDISYSPTINTAKDVTVEVEPDDSLLDGFLGGTGTVEINGDEIFSDGKIVEIEPNQNDEPYTVRIESPGKRLEGRAIERTTNNEIAYDIIAKEIDRYNEVDAEKQDLAHTESELLFNAGYIGGQVVQAFEDGGSVEYRGLDLPPDKMYSKMYGEEITVRYGKSEEYQYDDTDGPDQTVDVEGVNRIQAVLHGAKGGDGHTASTADQAGGGGGGAVCTILDEQNNELASADGGGGASGNDGEQKVGGDGGFISLEIDVEDLDEITIYPGQAGETPVDENPGEGGNGYYNGGDGGGGHIDDNDREIAGGGGGGAAGGSSGITGDPEPEPGEGDGDAGNGGTYSWDLEDGGHDGTDGGARYDEDRAINVTTEVGGSEHDEGTIIVAIPDTENTYTGLNESIYGHWVNITPPEIVLLEDGDDVDDVVIFDLPEDGMLMDWISIADQEISREVDTVQVEEMPGEDWIVNEAYENVNKNGEGIVVDDENEQIYNRQICDWRKPGLADSFTDDFDEKTEEEATIVEVGGSSVDISFNVEDEFQNWGIAHRMMPIHWQQSRFLDDINGDHVGYRSWSGEIITDERSKVGDYSVQLDDDSNRMSKNCIWEMSTFTDDIVLHGYFYHDGLGTFRIGATEGLNDWNGYAFQVRSNEIRIQKWDQPDPVSWPPNTITLDSESASVNNGEWVYFEFTVDGEDQFSEDEIQLIIKIEDSDDTYLFSTEDTDDVRHNSFSTIQCDGSNESFYLDDFVATTTPLMGEAQDRSVYTDMTIDGNTHNGGLFYGDPNTMEWAGIVNHGFTGNWPDSLNGSVDYEFSIDDNEKFGVVMDAIVLLHERSEWDVSKYFDNEPTEVGPGERYLDYPPRYAEGAIFDNSLTFNEHITRYNITSANVDTDITEPVQPTKHWGISQVISFEEDSGFPEHEQSIESTQKFSYPGRTHIINIKLPAQGDEKAQNPRFGHEKTIISEYNVDVETNDLSVFADHTINNNVLAAINNIAEESDALFKINDTEVEIFQMGTREFSADISRQSISSRISIQDTYSSCEVVGNGVKSGVVESTDAPDYVEAHKIIYDETIETEEDAIRRAIDFLKQHGEVQYTGSMDIEPAFVPLGEMMDGSNFSHGQDMMIENVRYSIRGSNISLGFDRDFTREFIQRSRDSHYTSEVLTRD